MKVHTLQILQILYRVRDHCRLTAVHMSKHSPSHHVETLSRSRSVVDCAHTQAFVCVCGVVVMCACNVVCALCVMVSGVLCVVCVVCVWCGGDVCVQCGVCFVRDGVWRVVCVCWCVWDVRFVFWCCGVLCCVVMCGVGAGVGVAMCGVQCLVCGVWCLWCVCVVGCVLCVWRGLARGKRSVCTGKTRAC